MDTDDALIRGDLARQLRHREIALAPKWRAATWYDAVACDASRFRVERGAVSDLGVLSGSADVDAGPEPRADTHPVRGRDDGGGDGRTADADAGSDNVPGDADAAPTGDAMHLAGPGADRDRDPALRDADPAADVRPVGSDGSPDHAAGAIIGCECSQCREARLADPDRIVYGAMDVASAYRDGWHDGYGRALRRILECS